MSNIKDVAKQAGVSISTVSRVINGTKAVSPELRVKVEKAIDQLNYSTNTIARGLKLSQTNRIAIIVTSLSRTFFTSVLEGVHQEAFRRGYSVVIAETHDNINEEIQLVDLFASQWVDGIILASSAYGRDQATRNHVARLSKLRKKDSPIPVVTLEFPLDNKHVDAVVIDHEQAAYDTVNYLIQDVGRREIIHLSHPSSHYIGQKRIAGYKRALKDAGLPVRKTSIFEGNYTTYSGYQLTRQLLQNQVPCDAIFCANDQLAVGALKACEEAQVAVPDQIAIIGVDDIFAASIVSPTLSSLHIPKVEMGATAMALLGDLIERGPGRRRRIITLDYKIIERATTKKDSKNSLKYLEW